MGGKVLNVEGLDSEGPYRNEYSGITAIGTGFIVQKGDTIEIGDMKIRLRIDDIKVHMECLFPKTGGPACCEKDRQFKSCNPILAKTIHSRPSMQRIVGHPSLKDSKMRSPVKLLISQKNF